MYLNEQVKIFFDTYNFEEKIIFWQNKHNEFIDIWKNRIISGKAVIDDFDQLVFIIDVNARNSTKEDEAVARTFIRYPVWYKCFQDITEKNDIRELIEEAFNSPEEKIVEIINKLYKLNLKNRNGLTTKSGIILNALLFLNKPNKYITSLSMKHRKIICDKLGIQYNEVSEAAAIIDSNQKIINYFKGLLDNINLPINSFIFPRFISDFIYSSTMKPYFFNDTILSDDPILLNTAGNQSFYLEKYLENFIYTNWEKIEKLGGNYEFILNSDNEPISLQYKTDIGYIDLLVKDKNDSHYLVIELKREQTSDQTIGQVTRYMGWVSENLTKGDKSKVKGLIIAASYDEKIKQSLKFVNDVDLIKYKVHFDLEYEKI